jgi:GAF domain-containing protein
MNASSESFKSSPEEAPSRRLAHYHEVLIRVHRNPALYQPDIQKIYALVCQTAAQTLGISRVSIWTLEKQNTTLVRRYLYEADGMTDEIAELQQTDYPAYFSAIRQKPYIPASDACTHPDTAEFSESYLKPLRIRSMLDCPILTNQEVTGVICCEHQEHYREWLPEDALFIQSLADLLAIVHQNIRILQLNREIRNQNFQLSEKNREIAQLNEELTAANEELARTNRNLEEAVRQRTAELERQNLQLTEYAFINSHLLRAPVARVLGLLQLIQLEDLPVRDRQLIDALFTTTQELDTLVREISEMLYSGHPISRDLVKQIVKKNLDRPKQ